MADVRSGLDPVDYRFINPNPDPDFSPERNKAIINETVKDTEKFFKTQVEAIDESLGNRIDILSTYGRYVFNKGYKDIKHYLGEKQYNALIGEKILSKLRIAETVNRLNGNTRFKKGILL